MRSGGHSNVRKIRPAAALALSAVLTWSLAAQTPRDAEMRERITQIGQGVLADVKLTSGAKLTGRIGPIQERDFVLEEIRQRKFQDQTIAFADIKSVQTAATGRKSRLTHMALVVGGSLALSFLIRAIRR